MVRLGRPSGELAGRPGWRLHNESVAVRLAAFGMPAVLFGLLGLAYRFGRR